MAHRIGKIQGTRSSSTAIDIDNGETDIFYGATSVLGYDGQGFHHTVYIHDCPGTVTLEVSTNATDWTRSGSTSTAAVLTTGNLNEPAPKYTRVSASGGSDNNKYTVISFSSLIPSP